MKRRNFLISTSGLTFINLTFCSKGTSRKISTDKTSLGKIVYSDSRGNYHMQEENNANYIIISSKMDYEMLDKLKKSGVDSVEVKPSDINFSYQGKKYNSYFIKK